VHVAGSETAAAARSRCGINFRVGLLLNEPPFIALYHLLVSTLLAFGQGETDAGLAVIIRREARADPAAAHAFRAGLGTSLRHRRLPWARILFAPLFMRRRDVERLSNRSYGDAGRRNQLDVYRHRSHPSACPVLIHLHGGHFVRGGKSHESLRLLYRLPSQGWVCISANYRLSPAMSFPEYLIDAKRMIAWVREHGGEYGADPSAVVMAGSSAGSHIAAMAALTPNDPALQPAFDHADITVAAAMCPGAYLGPAWVTRAREEAVPRS
jgi:acetyl esterase/lipase